MFLNELLTYCVYDTNSEIGKRIRKDEKMLSTREDFVGVFDLIKQLRIDYILVKI